jgi:hypothetical protein
MITPAAAQAAAARAPMPAWYSRPMACLSCILHACWYPHVVSAEIIQVRDVPSEEVDVLRARAASRGISLSSYLRELIHDDVSRPTMAEIVARIATRDSVEANSDDVRSFIEDGRR